MCTLEVLRVVLLGKTGTGKSSLGNTLLGRDDFFVPERSFSSSTFRCQWKEAERFGTRLQVTDTPGVSDTHREEDEVLREVGKSIAVACPGPHVFLLVVRSGVPFTKEDYNAYLILKNLFGERIRDYTIVVFTDADVSAEDLQEEIRNSPDRLHKVLAETGRRYSGLNNKAPRDVRDQKAQCIVTKIRELLTSNQGTYFTSPLWEEINREVELLRPPVATAPHGTPFEIHQAIVQDEVEPSFYHRLVRRLKDMLDFIRERCSIM